MQSNEDGEETWRFNKSMSMPRKSILKDRNDEVLRDNFSHESRKSATISSLNVQSQQMNQSPAMFDRSYRALNHGGYMTQLSECFQDSGHSHFAQSYQRPFNCSRGNLGQFGHSVHYQQPHHCQSFGQSFQSCCQMNAMPPFAQSCNVVQPRYHHPMAQNCMHQAQPAVPMGGYNYHHLQNPSMCTSPAPAYVPPTFHGFGGSQNIAARGQLPRRGLPVRIPVNVPVRLPVRKSEKESD